MSILRPANAVNFDVDLSRTGLLVIDALIEAQSVSICSVFVSAKSVYCLYRNVFLRLAVIARVGCVKKRHKSRSGVNRRSSSEKDQAL